MIKKLIIRLLIIALIVILVAILLYPYIMIGLGFSLLFNPEPPPEPAITYGEFPISITYEVNGELQITEDVIICEFDGFENHGTGGVWRKWKGYLKSGNEQVVLLKIDESSELYCWYGSPEYYMGDLRFETVEAYEDSREKNFESSFITLKKIENGEYTYRPISAEEAWDKYKFKVLDVQYSEPIENSFE